MTYEEFCEGVGMKVDIKYFERIEVVYMAFDCFENKQELYAFYKKNGRDGIEHLYYFFNRHGGGSYSIAAKRIAHDNAKNRIDTLKYEIRMLQNSLNTATKNLELAEMFCGTCAA